MDWTEIYRDAVDGRPLVREDLEWPRPAPPVEGLKTCRIIPCPGSYFPAHDEQCEMVWEEDDEGWGAWKECACEPRARAVRDAT
jgi:hypothetical protein